MSIYMNPEGKNELPIQVHKFRTHLKCWREKRSIDRQSVRHIVNEYNGRTERVIEWVAICWEGVKHQRHAVREI